MPRGQGPTLATYHEWWESDLSKFVSDHYGRPWRLQQQGDCLAQSSYLKVEVDGEVYIGSDDDEPWATDYHTVAEAEAELAAWMARKPPAADDWRGVMDWERDPDAPHSDLILWDLCRKGLIPAGQYLITVWW